MSTTKVISPNWSDWANSRINELFTDVEEIDFSIVESTSNLMMFHLLNAFDTVVPEGEDDFIFSTHWVYKQLFGKPYYLSIERIRNVKKFSNSYTRDIGSWLIIAQTIFGVATALANKSYSRTKANEMIKFLAVVAEAMPNISEEILRGECV